MKRLLLLTLIIPSFASAQSILSVGAGLSFNGKHDLYRSGIPYKGDKTPVNSALQLSYREKVSSRIYLGATISNVQYGGSSMVETFGGNVDPYGWYTIAYEEVRYKTNILSIQFTPLFRVAGSDNSLFSFFTGLGVGASCTYAVYKTRRGNNLDFRFGGVNIGIPMILQVSPFPKDIVSLNLSVSPQMSMLKNVDCYYVPITMGVGVKI